MEKIDERFTAEEVFHDEWAQDTDVEKVDVILANEAITAPEWRYISTRLGDIKGKSLLDVGSGLGEASVYFALKGAAVTATDISGGMLEFSEKLAIRYGVKIKTHKSTAEDLAFKAGEQFDIVYVGNLFHHVEIEPAILNIKKVMHPGSILVSVDPLAYNPIINIYRMIATKVRTEDEHPLKRRDIELFKKHFEKVELRFFWLTTLLIFMIMAVIQMRNPNKVRFWKVILQEGEKWAWLYKPLEAVDRFLIRIFPFLGWLCWNVVVRAEQPKN